MGLELTCRVVKCASCGMEMHLEEGTILYDARWFHNSCWSDQIQEGKSLDIKSVP